MAKRVTPPEADQPKSNALLWTAVAVAAVVSTAALILAAGVDRRSLGLSTSPFGWNRIIVIHTLSTLVLSWWFARVLGQLIPELKERWMTPVWGGVGILIAVLTVLAGIAVDALLDSNQSGYTARLVCRIAWCMALQVPWYMTALAATKGPSRPAVFSTMNLLAFSVMTAVGIPASFLAVFLGQQTEYARGHWQQAELLDAMLLVQRLYDVGSTVSLGGRSLGDGASVLVEVTPQAALRELRNNLTFMQDEIKQLEAAPASRDQALQLAQCYLSVGRTDDAEAKLKALAKDDPSSAIILAGLYKDNERTEDSRTWAKKALQLAQQTKPANEHEQFLNEKVQMQAYDMLAVFAGEVADFQQAEKYLLDALGRLPSLRAEIHDRLGKHFEFIGELTKASEHQREAARLDPEQFSDPASLVSKMLESGAPVGLARPKSSRYKHDD